MIPNLYSVGPLGSHCNYGGGPLLVKSHLNSLKLQKAKMKSEIAEEAYV